MRIRLNGVLFVLVVVTVGLCFVLKDRDMRRPNYEFLPETQMGATPAYGSFKPNPNFADGLTLRTPPSGTIPRGELPFHYQPTLQDALRAGLELQNPYSAKDEARLRRGNAVFNNYCEVCHGPLGLGNGPITRGGFPPPASLLADRALQPNMKDGQMFHILTYGQGNMPGFAAQLSRDDRWCAILHVRMLQEPYAPGPAQSRSAAIAKLFQENCAACHGVDGTGNNIRKVLPLIPDFTSLAWQMSQTEMAIVNQIDYGTYPMMPSFRYKLRSDQILSLAVYVRSFAAHGSSPNVSVPVAANITATNVYGTFCFACHDTNGKGNAVMRSSMPELPDFTTDNWQKSRTDSDLSQSILQGKGKFMLPMKDKLGSVDVKQMVALVRGFTGGKQVVALEAPKLPGPPAPAIVTAPTEANVPSFPALPPRAAERLVAPPGEMAARIRIGATIFQQYCIVCHGPDGTGSIMRASMPVIPNFTGADWGSQRSNSQIKISILDGKGTLMPANRGRVTDEEAGDLVAYIRAFGPKAYALQSQATDSEFEKSYRQLESQWIELEKELQKLKGKK
jgi:mono/diheme cytochrome c family protein